MHTSSSVTLKVQHLPAYSIGLSCEAWKEVEEEEHQYMQGIEENHMT